VRIFESISGSELADEYARGYFETLKPFVSSNPKRAIEKIVSEYGEFPSPSGDNIPVFDEIRQRISFFDRGLNINNGLMIVAPHTHWDENLPILISKENDTYLLSEKRPLTRELYHPVSYTFSNMGLLPYEWADSTAEIPIDDLIRLWRFLEDEFGSNQSAYFGLGISINYRFKRPLDENVISTTEFQGPEADGDGGAVIYRAEAAATVFDVTRLEQVGWTSKDNKNKNFSEKEQQAYSMVQNYILSLPDKISQDRALKRIASILN